jgi:hypothetical protein
VSIPTPVVYAYFDLSGSGGNFFTLNSALKGKLGDATYVLAGDLRTDITSEVRSVSVRRGRSRVLDEITAGVGTVTMDNRSRQFDPMYSSSPYYGNIVPGKQVDIEVAGVTIMSGSVENWELDYTIDRDSTVTLPVVDPLGELASITFDEWMTTASETGGTRLGAVLDRPEVNYTANRDFDTGISTLQADLVSWGSNVLNYCQLVAKSDFGYFFASRSGVITFRDRHAVLNASAAVSFADTSAGIRYRSISLSNGSDFLYNYVGVDRTGGTLQTLSDQTSIDAYKTRSLALSGLLLDSDAQSADMAQYLLSVYKDPATRVSSVTVQLARLSDEEQQSVLRLDLTDIVSVTFTPNGIGSAITQDCIVEGIAHDIEPGSHIVTLSLTRAEQASAFILDDATFGKLGGIGALSF